MTATLALPLDGAPTADVGAIVQLLHARGYHHNRPRKPREHTCYATPLLRGRSYVSFQSL